MSKIETERQILSQMDRVGTFLSTACAVHCILLPLVITLLPLFGLGLLADHRFEAVMLIASVSLATLSLCWGSYLHGKKHTLLLLVVAVTFFVAAHSMESSAHWVFMGLGGFCLATGHVLNRRLCKSCRTCSCEH